MARLSPLRRRAVVDALRRGTVPSHMLDVLAVGLERFESAVAAEFDQVADGGGCFKAVRGEYGTGKTFFVRWLQERARQRGFATSEVQVSEAETPLHRMETVYRRAMERLATEDTPEGALTSVVERWFYALESDVLAEGIDESSPSFGPAVEAKIEARLADRAGWLRSEVARSITRKRTPLLMFHLLGPSSACDASRPEGPS